MNPEDNKEADELHGAMLRGLGYNYKVVTDNKGLQVFTPMYFVIAVDALLSEMWERLWR